MTWAAHLTKEVLIVLRVAVLDVTHKVAIKMAVKASAWVVSTVLTVTNSVLLVLVVLNAIEQQESVPLVT